MTVEHHYLINNKKQIMMVKKIKKVIFITGPLKELDEKV
jgi:hypothetical protein